MSTANAIFPSVMAQNAGARAAAKTSGATAARFDFLAPATTPIMRTLRRRTAEKRVLRRIVSAYEKTNRRVGKSFQRGEDPTRENITLIVNAWKFAARMHAGEKRDSGEDYLRHCERVALKTARNGGLAADICAALLHDVIEAKKKDGTSKTSFFALQARFGKVIARKIALLTKPKWSGSEWVDALHPNYHKLRDRYSRRAKWNGRRWVRASEKKQYAKLKGKQMMIEARDALYYSRMLASGDLRMLAVKFDDSADNLETLDFVTGAKRMRKLVTTARQLLWISQRLDSATFVHQVDSLRKYGLSERQLGSLLKEATPRPVNSPVIVLPPRVLFDEGYAEELPPADLKNFATIYAHPNHLFCRDRLEVEIRLGRDVLKELQEAFPELRIRRGKSLLMAGQSGGGSCEFYVIEGFRPKEVDYVTTHGRNKRRVFRIRHGKPPRTCSINALRLHTVIVERLVPKEHWRQTINNYLEFQERFREFFLRIRNSNHHEH